MLALEKGVDLLSAVGGITTVADAKALFSTALDKTHYQRICQIENEEALLKVANAIAMCKPEAVYIHTGSEEDRQFVRDLSLKTEEEKPLAIQGHTIHFDLPQDQGRLVKQTFYIVDEGEEVSSLANKEKRADTHVYMQEHMQGIMQGKTMFVGFYSRGPVGAKASIPAIEISSSTYVFHSAELLYRNCFADFDAEVKRRGEFFTNVHAQGDNTPEDIPNARVYMDRSWQTTYSTFCTYAGNTLLMKKGNHRFASDSAIYKYNGMELSEHMFLTGITGPGERKTFFAGAAPSGCGKTTTSMVGSDFIGDDLVQMWIAEDGTLRGINPECGIFGIIEDVNEIGDPLLMRCLREEGTEVIFSNLLVDPQSKPRWTGDGERVPEEGFNFKGKWNRKMTDVPISHPNARCTLRADAIANHNAAMNADPDGVEIKIITYSGRDSDTMPPIWVAKSADAGVAIGASIVSKATAAEVGASGVRRQPWANAPFIAGKLADYLQAQFSFFNNPALAQKPIMAGLNYFLTHENRGGDTPGLIGEKCDVIVWLSWLEAYSHGEMDVIETPIGFIPQYRDLQTLFLQRINKDYTEDIYTRQFSLYIDNIIKRIDLQVEAWGKEEGDISRLCTIYNQQRQELVDLKTAKGAVVLPQNL